MVTFNATVLSPTAGCLAGTVTFKDGSTELATAATNDAGQARFQTVNLSEATHSIRATFAPIDTANCTGSTSDPVQQVVNRATTSVSLASSPNPSLYGQGVTFTATISSVVSVCVPGTVTFKEGATELGTTRTTAGSPSARVTSNNFSLGTHSITASFAPDATDYCTDTTSDPVQQVVQLAATSVRLASNQNPAYYGHGVIFYVDVDSVLNLCHAGTVTLKDGSNALRTVTTTDGGGAFFIDNLSLGTHSITASFAPDATDYCTGSTSNAVQQVVDVVPTSTFLASSANRSVFGQSVALTATVRSPLAACVAGTVTFKDGATTLGSATTNTGVATFATSSLSVGTHSVTASFAPDVRDYCTGSASGPIDQVVDKAPTSTELASSANPSGYGQPVTFTASVTSSSSACTAGTVTFKDGATKLGSATTNGSGAASFATSSLSVGTHSITASFAPSDTTHCVGSSTSELGQVMNRAATATSVTADPTASAFGQRVTFTASVAPASGKPVLNPTGTVDFYLNGASTSIATLPLGSNGTASFSTAGLGAGSNRVVAVYSGNGNFTGSTSAPATVAVGGRSCTITGDFAGGVVVKTGETVTVCGATVSGSITVKPGGALNVENSRTGSIAAAGAGPVRICGSSIGGIVKVSDSRSWVLVGDPPDGCAPNTVRGSLIMEGNHHGVQVIGNTVTGGVIATDNTGSGPFPNNTTAVIADNHS
ncbi:MAG: Ig-like domain-containing protein [Actinomycetota bacterium]|nr:Ig-like domain-containing protein [Actinomycetota bacterium]